MLSNKLTIKKITIKQTVQRSVLAVFAGFLSYSTAYASVSNQSVDDNRNYDARYENLSSLTAKQQTALASRSAAIQQMKAANPDFQFRLNELTGGITNLYNPKSTLSDVMQGTPEDAALQFMQQKHNILGLEDYDIDDAETVDIVYSKVTGVTHIYFRQVLDGVPVYGGQMQVHVDKSNRILSMNNGFIPDLRTKADTHDGPSTLSAVDAVTAAARDLGIQFFAPPKVVNESVGVLQRQTTTLSQPEISKQDMVAELMWLPLANGNVSLVWNFQIQMTNDEHWYDLTVDARTGKSWTRIDWVAGDSYRVYAIPCENPNDCNRTLEVDPADSVESPNAWHTSNIMDGNNVHAYIDSAARNRPPTNQPSCGSSRDCDFAINLNQQPSAYQPAALANVFYWSNIIHDTHAKYGFDEAAGNFQEDNFGRGGRGSDSVNAEAQDGSRLDNATFATPPDGSNPRMSMHLWSGSPQLDGDLDNGIIAHEYGHGISTRQVGGPSTNCLGGQQQWGEGHSDWVALTYTARASDNPGTSRPIGAYATRSTNGIRPQPYSTNPAINNATYQTIRSGVSVPHGVGFVWASMLWEMYWELVNKHGFSENISNPDADNFSFGNQRAMLYVNEGLKFTSCAGGTVNFLDGRDGIIQAASQTFGGEDVCDIWSAFARRGLGTNASTTGSNASATNGFNVPASCGSDPDPDPDPDPTPGSCSFEDTFNTSTGWTIDASSNCSTGTYTRTNPTQQTVSGVLTQPDGDSDGSGFAVFTATNSSVGVNDVDGGVCVARSPTISVAEASSLSIDWFHGQRDTGDDPNGDFYRLEYSTNGGSSFTNLVNIGDVRTDANWNTATANIPAGANVVIRVSTSDGGGTGDIIEGGIDNVSICSIN